MPQLDEACSTMRGCVRFEELATVMHTVAREQGYAGFGYVDVGQMALAGDPEPFYISTLRTDFIANYRKENFIRYDPVASRSAAITTPFAWTDCPEFQSLRRRRRGPKSKSRRVIEAACDYGYTQGLVFPAHCSGKFGERASAFVSLFWEGAIGGGKNLEAQPLWLRIAAQVFHERVTYLRGMSSRTPTPPTPLAERERECLAWACRGMSVKETGDRLHVSARTVEFHVQRAMKKLGARSKVHAIAIAFHWGLLAP